MRVAFIFLQDSVKNNFSKSQNRRKILANQEKNWLFAGSERAGQRAAVIQTLFGTAKLNGLNPEAWLKDTLEKLPTWPNRRIDELLPLAPDVIEKLKSNKPDRSNW